MSIEFPDEDVCHGCGATPAEPCRCCACSCYCGNSDECNCPPDDACPQHGETPTGEGTP